MPKAMSLSDAIKAARRRAGLSMASLGRILHVKGATVSRWERGMFRPGHAYHQSLLDALSRAPPELLDVIRRELRVIAPHARTPVSGTRLALDSSILAMGEHLGPVATPALRAAAAAFLFRMRELHLDVAQACAAIEAQPR